MGMKKRVKKRKRKRKLLKRKEPREVPLLPPPGHLLLPNGSANLPPLSHLKILRRRRMQRKLRFLPVVV
jgi:hypothetical protein